MKVVILAGGLGTRISEYTKTIPKPMIEICKKPNPRNLCIGRDSSETN